MRIAFYAPLKAPDHPVPSGDRQMARMLVAALRTGGHDVDLVSTFRSFLSDPDPDRMRSIETAAIDETSRLVERWAREMSPELWFTYHPYFKAPDLLGPTLATRLGIPYATAEASHARRRAGGPWSTWHASNEAALRRGDLHVCFTPRDAAGLAELVDRERIVLLPPFLSAEPFAGVARAPRPRGPVALVTVAMMRPGDKARSFAFLARALERLPSGLDWRLTIVGDGPERSAVTTAFSSLPAERVVWAGQRDRDAVAAILAASDLYVWPGFGEAYGIAYLEAQAVGLPVLAMACGGIASVVSDGETGVLTPEGDIAAYAAAMSGLMADHALRDRLGRAGRRIILDERSLESAAACLSEALARIRPKHALSRG